jgi:hypothetical protein
MQVPIPREITREHVLWALGEIRRGDLHGFGPSTKYDLVHEDGRYPPKAALGIAARPAVGRYLRSEEFNGGESPGQTNPRLRKLGFVVVEKGVAGPKAAAPVAMPGVRPIVIRDDRGEALAAHVGFRVEANAIAIYLESRGGSPAKSNYRNPDYNVALWYLLNRLAAANTTLIDASVESRETVALAPDDKTLVIDTGFPVALREVDPEELRLQLQRAQRPIGRRSGGGSGGNNSKRIRLLVTSAFDRRRLAALLESGLVDESREAEVAVETLAGRRRGQGFATDAKVRKAVEDRAMAVVLEALEAENWVLEDVSTRRSYDFHCTRGTEEQRVEVKGSTGGAEEVIVTPNEVEHARARGDVWLGIVSGILLDRDADGTLSARGGTLSWHRPWVVDDGELVPLGYKWVAPSPGATRP